VPAFALTIYHYLDFHAWAGCSCCIGQFRGVAVGGADNGFDTGRFEAIFKIVLFQKEGGRNGNGAQLTVLIKMNRNCWHS
jgi:hypothetical protein